MRNVTRVTRIWGRKSKRVLKELDPRLQTLMTRVRDEVADISLISGHRDCDEQNTLFEVGASTLRWPDSKHNKRPALAVDFQPAPYPVNEKLWGALGYAAGRAFGIAAEMGIKIRWGGDWDGDGDVTDQKFDDLFHIELVDV